MRGSDAVQVVLGEGEPGTLRFVLEAEGFHVVGQARGEAELKSVLDVTHPAVIVLDAGISAAAAVDARSRSVGAQLVVVWPDAVRASIADDRVDPAAVLDELGAAVRRAAGRVREPVEDVVITLRESPPTALVDVDERHVVLVPDIADEPTPRTRRRGRHVLAIAAAWTLALMASAAVGLTVPETLGLFEPDAEPRVPVVTTPDRDSQDGPGSLPGGGSDEPASRRCDRPSGASERPSGSGRPDDPGRGCGRDQGGAKGRPDGPTAQGKGKGSDRTRPEDPGHGGGNHSPADATDGDAVGNGKDPGGNGNGADRGAKGSAKSTQTAEEQNETTIGNGRAAGGDDA